jgi:hypothetical protein
MSEIKVDTLTGKTAANDITVTVGATATQSLEQGLAKAWTSINQSTPAIIQSLNTASITDSGVGIIDPNFTNNMNAVGWCSIASLRNTGNYVHATILTDTTSKCRAQSLINANTGEDSVDIGVANYGDLA